MNENEQYHADKSRISKSGTDDINKTPRHYQFKHLEGNQTEPTKPMIFGSAFHSYILERDKFNNEFVVIPHFVGKGSRDKKQTFELENSHKTIITMDDMKTIMGMYKSIQDHPIASKLINQYGLVEKQFNWTDPETGAKCKCKPDKIVGKYDIDLKSTDDASPNGFKFSAKKFRYHVQAAFYHDGLKANNIEVNTMVFIAVEKTAPYLVGLYFYESAEMGEGRREYKENLKTYVECLSSGVWPGYSEKIMPLELPGFWGE